MPNRHARVSVVLVCLSLFLAATAFAQVRLTQTTSSEAAKAALAAALEEVTNFGGAHRADAKLKAVVDADPNFALGRAFYAQFTNNMALADRTRELEAALKAASNATAAEVLAILAMRESRAGRNPVARELMDAAIKLAPDEPILYWVRANVAANAAEALRISEETAKRFPDYAPIHNQLAYRLNTAGRRDEAFQTIQKYVTLLPNHPNPHDSYAELLQLNARYEEAIPHYQRALAIDPNFEAAHEGLAEIAVAQGNYAEARAHLLQSVSLAATPARRLVLERQIAATFLYEGKLKEAKAAMATVVADAKANSINALPDERFVAWLTALEGKSAEAAALWTAAAPPQPGPTFPLNDAAFHALLKHPAEVSKALSAMEANAARTPNVEDTQEALRTTRVIAAVANNDLAAARAALQQITLPLYKAIAASWVAQAARKAGDKATLQAALAEVEAYKVVTLNAGLARYIANKK